MVEAKNIYVLAPYTLDGAGACAPVRWFFEEKGLPVKCIPVTKTTIVEEINKISNDAKKIYIIGGYLLQGKEIPFNENITVFTLETDFTETGLKTIRENDKTYTNFLYNSFKDKMHSEFSKEKKLLLELIKDYLSYELKFDKLSIGINTIFSSTPGREKIEIFLNKFREGFKGFSEEDKEVINHHTHIKKNILEGEKFVGVVNMGGRDIKIISVFGENCMLGCVNEVAHEILNKYNKDIAIVVNPSLNFVSFRKNNQCSVNLKHLANKLCDGDGKEYASSGKITEKFLSFTKLLAKMN